MNILSWNINHRTRKKAINPEIQDLIAKVQPDILFLHEYVDDPSREDFKKFLETQGLVYQHVSESTPGHNQILLASKSKLTPIENLGGAPIEPILSNQCMFTVNDLTIYALRVPFYKTRGKRRLAWDFYLTRVAEEKPAVVVGDLNVESLAADRYLFDHLVRMGYQQAVVAGASFWTNQGVPRTLDHVFARGVRVQRAHFIDELDGRKIVGKTKAFASDHSALMFEVAEMAENNEYESP